MTALPGRDGFSPGRTDAELVRATAAGDQSAFAAIYDRFADRLHDFCIGMLRNRDAAADCVQDTFCIAATTMSTLREPDKLRPWLYAIARNEALRRLRERRRERPSDELPDAASRDAGANTIARRNELADLIAEAAGGLSDRDRLVLELSYRHGMDGPELAHALGVSQTNAGTLVHRVRDTIERCLGALLVSRRVQSSPARCPQLAAILHGWDGRFTVLIRKRVSRHIESCSNCDQERRRLVSPAALLGAPIFIPAPRWLRDRTMREVALTCSADELTVTLEPVSQPAQAADSSTTDTSRRVMLLMALFAGIPLMVLGVVVVWMYRPVATVAPIGETETSVPPISTPASAPPTAATSVAPTSSSGSTLRPQPTRATRATPTPTAAVPDPNAGRTATAPQTIPPSTEAPPTLLPTPAPSIPAPTPPPSEEQAPPPAQAPAPATTYVPMPENQAPPPVDTYKPGPFVEPTFMPPR